MGNNQSQIQLTQQQIQQYLRPGLTQQDIIGLANAFEGLGPTDGIIKVSKLKQLYSDSYDKQSLDLRLGNKITLNFDQFYEIMAQDIIEKKRRFGNIEFDSHQNEITCVLCPYTVDKPTNQI